MLPKPKYRDNNLRPKHPKKENKPIYPSIGIKGKPQTIQQEGKILNIEIQIEKALVRTEKLQELKIVGEVEKSVLTFHIYYYGEGMGARKMNRAVGMGAKYRQSWWQLEGKGQGREQTVQSLVRMNEY